MIEPNLKVRRIISGCGSSLKSNLIPTWIDVGWVWLICGFTNPNSIQSKSKSSSLLAVPWQWREMRRRWRILPEMWKRWREGQRCSCWRRWGRWVHWLVATKDNDEVKALMKEVRIRGWGWWRKRICCCFGGGLDDFAEMAGGCGRWWLDLDLKAEGVRWLLLLLRERKKKKRVLRSCGQNEGKREEDRDFGFFFKTLIDLFFSFFKIK